MNKSILDEFNKSLQTGYVDKESISEVLYQPELLVNQKKPKKKVLSTIIQELENCETYFISVAIDETQIGKEVIRSVKTRVNQSFFRKVLVSQYLNFTQPEALKRLSQLNNIELRIATKNDSHSKGYIFKSDKYTILLLEVATLLLLLYRLTKNGI